MLGKSENLSCIHFKLASTSLGEKQETRWSMTILWPENKTSTSYRAKNIHPQYNRDGLGKSYNQ